jgi:hypothetical protein
MTMVTRVMLDNFLKRFNIVLNRVQNNYVWIYT